MRNEEKMVRDLGRRVSQALGDGPDEERKQAQRGAVEALAFARRSRSRTWLACHSASALRRVAMRIASLMSSLRWICARPATAGD